MKRKLVNILLRIIIGTLLYCYIKIYDRSFDGVFDYGPRGVVYHLYFILFTFLVWEGVSLVYRILNRKLLPGLSLLNRLALLGTVLTAYGVLIALLFSSGYYLFVMKPFGLQEYWIDVSYVELDLTFGAFLFFVLVTGFHGIGYFYSQWKEAEIKSERLLKENVLSRFEALKNQVEPHFFFNSLSVLTKLVYKDPDLSAEYIMQLSKMYRYILENKGGLVSLEKELEFLGSYTFLIGIRHDEHIHFDVKIDPSVASADLIPQNSLQMLAENAIKHNQFSGKHPLRIRIDTDGSWIRVTNNLNRRNTPETTPGTGLKNIRSRYELLSGKSIMVGQSGGQFTVKLPRLNKEDYEDIDI